MNYTIRSLVILVAASLTAQLAAFGASPRRHEKPKEVNEQSADASTAATKALGNVDSLSRWMTFYYMKPTPELLVPALLSADQQGLLQGDSAPPLQAFASRVLAQNPDKVKEWFVKMGPLSESGKTMVLTAIWWSNTKEGKELLSTIASTLPDKSKAEFHKQIDSAPPEIDNMDISSPDIIDMLWACFSATGDTKYVKRLMTTLSWGKSDSKDLPAMIIASAARWSLISNINQHPKVKEFCLSSEKQDAVLKPYLEKVLAEATTAAAKAETEKSNITDSDEKKHKSGSKFASEQKTSDKTDAKSASEQKTSDKTDAKSASEQKTSDKTDSKSASEQKTSDKIDAKSVSEQKTSDKTDGKSVSEQKTSSKTDTNSSNQ